MADKKWQDSEFVRLIELIAIHGRLRANNAFRSNNPNLGLQNPLGIVSA